LSAPLTTFFYRETDDVYALLVEVFTPVPRVTVNHLTSEQILIGIAVTIFLFFY
jgi:hypothetical protein